MSPVRCLNPYCGKVLPPENWFGPNKEDYCNEHCKKGLPIKAKPAKL